MKLFAAAACALIAIVVAGLRLAPLVVSPASPVSTATSPGNFLSSTEPVAEYPSGSQIPTDRNVPSDKKFCEIYKSWGNRIIVDHYKHLHPGEQKVPPFLTESFGYFLRLSQKATNEFNAHGETLEQAGIDDPAFFLMAGLLRVDVPSKERLLGQAVAGFQKSDYSPFLLFLSAANLSKSLADRGADPSLIANTDQIALEALKKGLGPDSFQEQELAALRWRLTGGSAGSLFERRGAEAAEIVKQADNLPEWIKEFAQGRIFKDAAWGARGDGWSDEVTPEGAVGFQQNLELARQHLTAAWELNPSDPGAATCMISVIMGESGDKTAMRQWFDRAVAAELDCQDAYNGFIWALRPRWHGSHAEMLLFADECVRSNRFDTVIPSYYLKIVREVASEESDHDAIYKRPVIYRNLRYVLETYLQSTDMPFSRTYTHTLDAIFDYKNGNLPGARNHLVALNFQPDPASDLALLEDLPAMVKKLSASN